MNKLNNMWFPVSTSKHMMFTYDPATWMDWNNNGDHHKIWWLKSRNPQTWDSKVHHTGFDPAINSLCAFHVGNMIMLGAWHTNKGRFIRKTHWDVRKQRLGMKCTLRRNKNKVMSLCAGHRLHRHLINWGEGYPKLERIDVTIGYHRNLNHWQMVLVLFPMMIASKFAVCLYNFCFWTTSLNSVESLPVDHGLQGKQERWIWNLRIVISLIKNEIINNYGELGCLPAQLDSHLPGEKIIST